MNIDFFNIKTRYTIKSKNELSSWLVATAKNEGYKIDSLNIIICSDEYLYKMNMQFLKHDTYTDIITFDQSTVASLINAELYISIDRIRDNAKSQKSTILNELHRVIVHGLLHVCGYKDKMLSDKGIMSDKEDFYLSLRKFL